MFLIFIKCGIIDLYIGGIVMAYCSNCGYKLNGKEKFCPSCGIKIAKKNGKISDNKEEEKEVEKEEISIAKIIDKIDEKLNIKDETSNFDEKDIKDNKVMGVLSYCSFLVLIPYFSNKDSKYVEYHASQGMNLLIVNIIFSILWGLLSLIKVDKYVFNWGDFVAVKRVTPWWINTPMTFISLILVLIFIYAIVNVIMGKAKKLPIINKIKIIK